MSAPDRVNELFAQAIQLESAEERVAFLARACGSEPHLQPRVDRLLAAHEKAGVFLEKPGGRRLCHHFGPICKRGRSGHAHRTLQIAPTSSTLFQKSTRRKPLIIGWYSRRELWLLHKRSEPGLTLQLLVIKNPLFPGFISNCVF